MDTIVFLTRTPQVYSFICYAILRFCKLFPTGMTTEVYPIRNHFASLVLLASKSLNYVYNFICFDMRRFYKCLSTRMTTEVYPIRQSFMSLAYLVSKTLKQVLNAYNTAFLQTVSDWDDQRGLSHP